MIFFKKKTRVNVVIIQPVGYINSLALLEIGEYFCALAKKCGCSAELTKNRFDPRSLNIVLCAHLLNSDVLLPEGSIVFNSEQLGEQGGAFDRPHYRELLRRHPVWDYSPANLVHVDSEMRALVPLYYCQELDRIHGREKVIDLLFYGSMTERRSALLAELQRAGVNVMAVQGVYGPERDDLLAQSRAVLNLHHSENRTLEQARCFYALTNSIPVFSEPYGVETAPADYAKALLLPDGQRLADHVAHLLSNRAEFSMAAYRRIELFRSLDPLPEFRQALEGALENRRVRGLTGTKIAVPPRMNLGSGKDYRPGYLNVDVDPSVGPDVAVDLSNEINLPYKTVGRWGEVTFDHAMFDEIVAYDVLEHVGNLCTVMTNCLALLKIEGRLVAQVPYDLSLGAWQDPTHVRAFNENSWLYFTDWFWYLGWFEHRFECEDRRVLLSRLGEHLKSSGMAEQELIRTPRAVDAMLVTLVKRETTVEERQIARAYRYDLHLLSRNKKDM